MRNLQKIAGGQQPLPHGLHKNPSPTRLEKSLREQLHQTELALRRSDAHYCALQENPAYGMCSCAMDGQFLNVNHTLVTMLGYASREELLAIGAITSLIPDPADRAVMMDHCHGTTATESVEIGCVKKDGTPLRVQMSAWTVSDEHGVPEGFELITEDVTGRRALEDQLRQQAETDSLTELGNHRHFMEVLAAEIERAKRTLRAFAIVLLDLDELKKINDVHGHLTGNKALCRLADTLRLCCRNVDTATRIGGDEFALVLPETGAEAAAQVAQRICDHLAGDGEQPKLAVSVGVAIHPKDGETIESLLESADRALYKMKGRQGHLFPEHQPTRVADPNPGLCSVVKDNR